MGLIFLALLMVFLTTLIVGVLLLGTVAYVLIPPLFQEFMKITELYFTLEFKKAVIRHFFHLLFFLPFLLYILYLAFTLGASYWKIFAIFIFLGSSFFGFYIFIFFLYSLVKKSYKRVFVSLFLGAGVFVFFAPSAYVLFEPIVVPLWEKYHEKSSENPARNVPKEEPAYKKEQINIGSVKLPSEEQHSYNYYLNMKPSTEVTNVKLVDMYEDFLVASASYNFEYTATPKFFEFLATHNRYPKQDPKNVPVHKVSCNGYASKEGDECYFGVLYPYFHNIIYTPKSLAVRHAIGYYCW